MGDNTHGLMYRGKLYIPASDKLRLHIVRPAHDAPAAGHPDARRHWSVTLLAPNEFSPAMSTAKIIENDQIPFISLKT